MNEALVSGSNPKLEVDMRTLVLMLSIGLFLGSSVAAKAATTAESVFTVVTVSNVSHYLCARM